MERFSMTSIPTSKSSFVIYGHGFDSTRADSGNGSKIPQRHWIPAWYSAIDQTGQYAWFSDNGSRMQKIKIKGWEQQSTSLPTGAIMHPSNVPNNYGVLFAWLGDTYVFDLTTNEIITRISHQNALSNIFDCILVNDKIYVTHLIGGRTNVYVHTIDITNGTHTTAVIDNNKSVCGFVDDNTLYAFYPIEWFSDWFRWNGYGLDGALQWTGSAQELPNVKMSGALCGNGKITLPTLVNGVWRMGTFDGNSAPDFQTPSPIKTFGKFDTASGLAFNYAYNQGRTKALFETSDGTYLTDFNSITKLYDTVMHPLALDDKTIIVANDTRNYIEVL